MNAELRTLLKNNIVSVVLFILALIIFYVKLPLQLSNVEAKQDELKHDIQMNYVRKEAMVGIYSTSFQWGQIVNTLPDGSNLNGLQSWLPGANDLAGAQATCFLPALSSGGSVIMTQYTTDTFDYDYSCI